MNPSSILIMAVFNCVLIPFLLLTVVSNTPESATVSSVEDEDTTMQAFIDPCAELRLTRKLTESYVYDVIRKKCISSMEPDCPTNMELRSMPDNESLGLCDCISHRPAIYNCSTDTCNVLYRQEYCAPGQWLIPNGEGEIICTLNECDPSTSRKDDDDEAPLTEYTLYNGECGAIGFHHPDCGQNETLAYENGQLEPVCVPLSILGGGSGNRGFAIGGSVPNLQCSGGTKWSQLTNNCQTPRHFNLN